VAYEHGPLRRRPPAGWLTGRRKTAGTIFIRHPDGAGTGKAVAQGKTWRDRWQNISSPPHSGNDAPRRAAFARHGRETAAQEKHKRRRARSSVSRALSAFSASTFYTDMQAGMTLPEGRCGIMAATGVGRTWRKGGKTAA